MTDLAPAPNSDRGYGRACDTCRQHKVRCLPGSGPSCQRCEKNERECVHTAPQKRKQRKRTDTLVAELGREVKAIRALFDHGELPAKKARVDAHREVSAEEGSENAAGSSSDDPKGIVNSGHNAPERTNISGGSSPSSQLAQYMPEVDVIDKGILSLQQTDFLLMIYMNHLVYHSPCVIFPPGTTIQSLRRSKPTLFLAVMAAASSKFSPRLYNVLYKEAITAYAHRTVINGEKNLELVQAMLIICIWYNPPGRYALLKYYEYVHMAVNMAIDLGLGTNPRSARSRREKPLDLTSQNLTASEMEQRRTILFCYLISFSSSMSTKRANMLRYNSWLEECLLSFSRGTEIPLHDQILVALVQLVKITENIQTSLSLDDLDNIASLSEPRVQMMVSGYNKTLERWRREIDSIEKNEPLLMAYHYAQIYLHELSLHDDHLPESFIPPYVSANLFSVNVDPLAKSSHIEATSGCISHIQSLFDVFLGMSLDSLRAAPMITFVRLFYAAIISIKTYISSKTPESKIGVFIEPSKLRLEYYLGALVQKMRDASGPMECRAPLTFLHMVMWLHEWVKSQSNQSTITPPIPMRDIAEACTLPPLSDQSRYADPLANGTWMTMDTRSVPEALTLDLESFSGMDEYLGQGFTFDDAHPLFEEGFNGWDTFVHDSTVMNKDISLTDDLNFMTTSDPLG